MNSEENPDEYNSYSQEAYIQQVSGISTFYGYPFITFWIVMILSVCSLLKTIFLVPDVFQLSGSADNASIHREFRIS